MKIISLISFEQESSLRTFKIGVDQQDLNPFMIQTIPLDFDVSNSQYCYIYNEINEEDVIKEFSKNVD